MLASSCLRYAATEARGLRLIKWRIAVRVPQAERLAEALLSTTQRVALACSGKLWQSACHNRYGSSAPFAEAGARRHCRSRAELLKAMQLSTWVHCRSLPHPALVRSCQSEGHSVTSERSSMIPSI